MVLNIPLHPCTEWRYPRLTWKPGSGDSSAVSHLFIPVPFSAPLGGGRHGSPGARLPPAISPRTHNQLVSLWVDSRAPSACPGPALSYLLLLSLSVWAQLSREAMPPPVSQEKKKKGKFQLTLPLADCPSPSSSSPRVSKCPKPSSRSSPMPATSDFPAFVMDTSGLLGFTRLSCAVGQVQLEDRCRQVM